MPPRYATLWEGDGAHWWDRGPLLPALQAEEERRPAETGLLDTRGVAGKEPGQWRLVWEHQMLEKGAMPVSRPDQTWHVYRRD